MVLHLVKRAFVVAAVVCISTTAQAISILGPGDPILGIDIDPAPGSSSNYPGGEPPSAVLDGNSATKYLNFAGQNTGFIVTPAFGSSQVQSFVLTTANDAPDRDPTSWELFGTNDAVLSLDNSNAMGGEVWTPLDSGSIALPDTRFTLGPVVPVANGNPYTSYWINFPTLNGSDRMQIADAAFYESNDGTGANVLAVGDPILAIHVPVSESRYPGGERPDRVLDGDTGTKYLNFGESNSGFIVTPQSGPEAVRSFRISTANDAPERDPTSWQLYGTNDPIISPDNSRGDDENWILLDEGAINLPTDRFAAGPFVVVDNDTAYSSYRLVFPTVRDATAANSLQISEVQFFSTRIPEPGTISLAALAFLGCCVGLRRSRR